MVIDLTLESNLKVDFTPEFNIPIKLTMPDFKDKDYLPYNPPRTNKKRNIYEVKSL